MKYGRELPGYPYNAKAKATRAIVAAQRMLINGPLRRISSSAPLTPDFRGEAANDAMYRLCTDSKPRMSARWGWGEIETTLRGVDVAAFRKRPLRQILRFLRCASGPFWWDNSIRAGIVWIAGYFPETNEALEKFAQRMCRDVKETDILASYAVGEKRLMGEFCPDAKAIPLEDYEPFFHENPWSRAFAGRRVLFVNSFVDTIKAQYAKRKLLFKNPDVLPEFELLTYRSVSSLAGAKTPFATWFDALDKMCDDISKIEFDIAVIGAGAYGLPLAAFVKRDLGRTALHTGGMTQTFFGIKGSRWDAQAKYRDGLYNDAWTRPLPSDTIDRFRTVEGGSYW